MTDLRRDLERFFISALWVVPVSREPLCRAVLSIADGRIEAILSQEEFAGLHLDAPLDAPLIDYGQAIICPGLINCHTHLDYSALRLFDTSSALLDWIPGLARHTSTWSAEQWLASALEGAAEVALSGTTCIADCSYRGASAAAAARLGLRAVVALELFGIDERQADRNWMNWLTRLEAFAQAEEQSLQQALHSGRVRLSVSPHAPYTVCPRLWRKALEWAGSAGVPLLTHLAESAQEVRWIAAKDAAMDSFLDLMMSGGLPSGKDLAWKGCGQTPVAHLFGAGLLKDKTIAAHAVQLNDKDIALLADSSCAVVHCPRSNVRLRNGVAPLDKLLAAGIKVAFGTDSAASSDDLNILCEARFGWNLARAMDTSFSRSSEEALKMLTLHAAEILGLGSEVGSLEAGKRADIAVFSIGGRAQHARERPCDILLYGEANLKDLFVDGKAVVKNGQVCREPLTCLPDKVALF